MEQSYVALLPVKPPAVGKSRLRGLSDDERRGLAESFALDTATACLSATRVTQVVAVTDDAHFARRLRGLGCVTIPDAGADGLNSSLRLAAAESRRRWPRLVPVAVCADLPSLRPAELDEALGAGSVNDPAFVADAAGLGTTLYRAPYDRFEPRFGPGSRAAHLASGAVQVGDELRSLRLDVDDVADLRTAVALGLGMESRQVARRLAL